DLHHLSRRGLGIAPGDGDDGIRVAPDRPANHLAALFVTGVGHGTGIDDINVRLLIKIHPFITGSLKHLPNRFRLVGIHLAAQGVESHGIHRVSPPISPFAYIAQASIVTPAGSVRKIRGPKLTGTAPASRAWRTSSSSHPPSGPTIKRRCEAPCRDRAAESGSPPPS